LRNHVDGVAAIGFFVVPTLSFQLLYGLLIMGYGRRQIVWLGVTAHPTAEWIANQLTAGCGWEQLLRDLIGNRDALVYSSAKFGRLAFATFQHRHVRCGRTRTPNG